MRIAAAPKKAFAALRTSPNQSSCACKGNLYGTTIGGGASDAGTVFELMPPASHGGPWTETVMHAFTGGSDGGYPFGSLIADQGNLYGTTFSGGASKAGTVFELTPPAAAGGTWTETVLHAFTGGSDGGYPYAGLIAGKGILDTTIFGLYGTTFAGGASDGGTVFELLEPTQPPRRNCAQCSSPPTCCICAGGTWTGSECL